MIKSVKFKGTPATVGVLKVLLAEPDMMISLLETKVIFDEFAVMLILPSLELMIVMGIDSDDMAPDAS